MRRTLLRAAGRILVLLACFISFMPNARAMVITGLSSQVQPPMEFVVQQGTCLLKISCTRWIYAYGTIGPDSPARLRAVLDTLGDERVLIALNSAGGDYRAAVEMGKLVRQRILPVTVASSTLCKRGYFCSPPELKPSEAACDYACVLVLLGSTTRTMPQDLTFHLPRLADGYGLPPDAIRTMVADDGGQLIGLVDDYLAPKALDLDLKRTIVGTGLHGRGWLYAREAETSRIITAFSSSPQAGTAVPAAPSVAEVKVKVRSVPIAGLASADQPPMDFVLFERAACSGEPGCGRWISAEGRIGPKTAAAFQAFLKKRKLSGVPLMLNSAGGDYAAAMEIGRIARDRKLKVGVAVSIAQDCPQTLKCRARLASRKVWTGQVRGFGARCDFACLFILAGGVDRAVDEGLFVALPYLSVTEFSLGEGARQGFSIDLSDEREALELHARIRHYLIDMLWGTDLYVALVRPGNNVVERTGPDVLRRFALSNRSDGPQMLLRPQEPAEPSIIGGSPMQFVVAHSTPETCKPQCRRWIVAEGTITENSPARLRKLLKSLGREKLPIVLQSEGGSVGAAMTMGIMIRDAGLDVAVGRTEVADCRGIPEDCLVPAPGRSEIAGKLISGQSVCASACPLMLAGGRKRYVSPWSFLVVHTQFNIKPDDKKHPRPEVERIVEAPISIRKPITRYLKVMGVKPKLFDLMRSASATSFRIVAPDEALALRLTTDKAPASALVGLAGE